MKPRVLNSKVVRNPVALGEVLDEWLRKNEPMRAARTVLLRREQALQRRCERVDPTGATWRLFLRVDEIHVRRLVDTLSAAIPWAFRQGRRSQIRGAK